MTHYSGKHAIVFGGSSGIGLAAARLLQLRGASVSIASDRRIEAPEDSDLQLRWIECDVVDNKAIANTIESATGGSPLDWLVYSAGIQRYGKVTECSEQEWDLVQAVNVKGAYLAARHAIPRMSRGGAIVNVSSVQAIACQQGVAAYAASKGAMDSLTRAMALDHAVDGIRVNAVLPGTVDTPMVRHSAEMFAAGHTSDAVVERWGRLHPLGRVAQPDEIAKVIAFLLSDDASFVTGSTVQADGGLLAQLSVNL